MWPVPVPVPIPLVVCPLAVWAPVVQVRDVRLPGGGDARQHFADLYDAGDPGEAADADGD